LAEPREIEVANDGVSLTGSLWLPGDAPKALVVMQPGFGREDRDGNGYFEPIRAGLLAGGYAVSSFDKRGVGGSGGRWQDAPIETQARDMLAAVRALSAEPDLENVPVGLFGHSQGGWVVIEAGARRDDLAFLILNSGPGVSPSAQQRYSTRNRLEKSGVEDEALEQSIARYDLMVRLARALTPFSEVEARREELKPHLPSDATVWRFWISILDYDPRSALGRTHAPILALYGENDPVVPVEESIEVLRSVVPPTRIDIEVFRGANHRIQTGSPRQLVPEYIERVLSFLESRSQS
jgi:pimeloyl-ACP methyl ester carboxylesterase